MALIPKKKFADLAGVKTSYITQYIERGKISAIGDLIDDQDPKNIAFLEKRLYKNTEKEENKEDEINISPDSLSELFDKKLEDEFLWSKRQEYDPAREKDLIELNNQLPEGNKVIPRMIFDNIANGAIIELCSFFLKREANLRINSNLSLEGLQSEFERICRRQITGIENSITEIMDDIQEDQ